MLPVPPRRVPLARKQLLHEPLKLVLAILGVAVCVALVGLLFGMREGINRQVTTFEDNAGAEVYINPPDIRNFVGAGQATIPAAMAKKIEAVKGVTSATPLNESLTILELHGQRIAVLLIGAEPGRAGSPWKMAEGRPPTKPDEIALDNVLAESHHLGIGHPIDLRGRRLEVVGLTDRTSSWMTPIVFVTRKAAARIQRQGDAATVMLVEAHGVSATELRDRLRRRFPDLSILTREQISQNDRGLMTKSLDAPLLTMVAIALGVGAIVIGLTIYGFVSERRREFGALKAIGERNRRLYVHVSMQALAMGVAGLVAGILLQRGTGAAVHELWPRFLFVYLGWHTGLMAGAAILMTLAGGLIPIRVLARLDPAEVFRR